MRTLRFTVNDQIVDKDHNCDFSGLVPGTKGYLEAEFAFSPEWKDTVRIAEFYSSMGRELPCRILRDGYLCDIPEEAVKRRTFKIRVIGMKKSGAILTTNKVVVSQNGGREE